jgi:hypothetical protein
MVNSVSSRTKDSPSENTPSLRDPPSHFATFSPASLRESRSWLPEQVTSRVFAPTRLKYFRTTTLCARPSTNEARSRWSPAITTTSKSAAIPSTQSSCGSE